MKTTKHAVLILALLLTAWIPGTRAATINYGNVTQTPSYSANNFPDVWDLTECDLTLSYTIDLSGVTQTAAYETPYVEVGLRELGASNFNPGPFNVYQGGAGGWMTSLVGDLATNPNLQDLDDKHNLSASGGRGEGDYDATDPSTIVAPFGTSLNKGIWFDRDGVDPYQDDSAANTGGIYKVVIKYHAVSDTLGTMFATVYGLTTGFDTTTGDGFNIDTDPAGLSFKGNMQRMQVFTGAWYTGGAGGNVPVNNITVSGCLASVHVSTYNPMGVTCTSALLKGCVVDDGGLDCESRFQYWTEGGPLQTTPWQCCGRAPDIFTKTLGGLVPDTTYSYRAELRNPSASDLGDIRSFTTLSRLATSSTAGGSVAAPGEGVFGYAAGTTVPLEATADPNGKFTGWSGSAVDLDLVDDPNAAVTSVLVTGDVAVNAQFAPIPDIIWVSETVDRNEDGIQDDQKWIDWVTGKGYVVDVRFDNWLELDAEKVAELNEAKLVIISRTASSGGYASDANEVAAWGSVTTPILCLSAWHVRSNRLKWINSGTVNRTLDTYMMAVDSGHPVLAGVPLEDDLVEVVVTEGYADGYQGNCVVAGVDVGNGLLIGQTFNDETFVAEWFAGMEAYEGAGVVQAGPRMLFCAGTENASLSAELFPQGGWNLSAAGEQMFGNAVAYMLGL